jgi:hypothetical protein
MACAFRIRSQAILTKEPAFASTFDFIFRVDPLPGFSTTRWLSTVPAENPFGITRANNDGDRGLGTEWLHTRWLIRGVATQPSRIQ